MKEDTVCSILRLIAVVTVLVGAILVTMTIVSLIGASSSMGSTGMGVTIRATGVVAKMGFFMVLANGMIAVWGLALYRLSPKLARWIVE